MIIIIGIILIIVGLVLCYFAGRRAQTRQEQINKQQAKLGDLQTQQNQISDEVLRLQKTKTQVEKEIQQKNEQVAKLLETIHSNEDYCYNKSRQRVEQQITLYKKQLKQQAEQTRASYEQQKEELDSEIEQLKKQLQTWRNTKRAAAEADLREEQINQNKDSYCLIPNKSDLADIQQLREFRARLHKPRILDMLIWQTYYQPLAKKQFPKILGTTSTVCGIYRITNQKDGISYVGQAVDIDKRWKEHCKCGLGIDTPPGNKLYAAMLKDGLENFSFEVLEVCNKEQLNEKENFYINLYLTDKVGYNGNAGISKR